MRNIQRGIVTSIILIIFLILGITVASGYFIFYQNQQKLKSVNSFEECVKAGNLVLESYPRQCKSGGKSFTEVLPEEEKKKLVPPSDGQVCAQVITPAKNLKTSECKEFPTPCDVPEGWEKVGSCVDETEGWKTYKNEGYKYIIQYPSNWKVEYSKMADRVSFFDGLTAESSNVMIQVSNHAPANNSKEIYDDKKIGDIISHSEVNGESVSSRLIEKFSLNGNSAYTSSHTTDKDNFLRLSFVYIIQPNRTVTIVMVPKRIVDQTMNEKIKNDYLPIFNQMISTVKFLE